MNSSMNKLRSMIREEITRIIVEDDWKQDPNDEVDMIRVQLRAMQEKIESLLNTIQDGDQFDAWVQSKITKASDYINSVYNYQTHEEDTKNL